MYKGILSNNQHVAIKHIIDDGKIQSFVREVTSLSHVRHPNLIALMGCCVMEDEYFLVYEFYPNGNLSEWLFGIIRFNMKFYFLFTISSHKKADEYKVMHNRER